MHKHLTHNKYWRDYRTFAETVLWFLRDKVPRQWDDFRDSVTDNFRIINPKDFRVVARTGYNQKMSGAEPKTGAGWTEALQPNADICLASRAELLRFARNDGLA